MKKKTKKTTTTKPKPNIALLRKIQKAILKYPDQFNMNWWFQGYDSVGKPAGRCGTAACIAGWAIALSNKFKGKKLNVVNRQVHHASSEAARLIRVPVERITGANPWHSEAKHPLFFAEQWPRKFWKKNSEAATALQAAQAASDRIDHFIKTGK